MRVYVSSCFVFHNMFDSATTRAALSRRKLFCSSICLRYWSFRNHWNQKWNRVLEFAHNSGSPTCLECFRGRQALRKPDRRVDTVVCMYALYGRTRVSTTRTLWPASYALQLSLVLTTRSVLGYQCHLLLLVLPTL